MQTKTLKILDKKEIKEIENIIEKNYRSDFDLEGYAVFETSDRKIWVASRKIFEIDLKKLAVNSIGLYLGKIKRNEKIHLSTEGSQMIGKTAKRNFVVLNEEDKIKFLQGSNVKPQEIEADYHNFVIVKSPEEILGCSLLTEEGLKNLVPKSRRISKTF